MYQPTHFPHMKICISHSTEVHYTTQVCGAWTQTYSHIYVNYHHKCLKLHYRASLLRILTSALQVTWQPLRRVLGYNAKFSKSEVVGESPL